MLTSKLASWSSRGLSVSALVIALAGNVSAQDSVQFSDLQKIAATVTAIDQAQRLVTLRGPEGNELTIEAGPDIRNLAQVEVGDIVNLQYEQAYMAERVSAEDQPSAAAAAAVGAARVAEGELPGGGASTMVTMIVMVESIGPDGRTATFITPDGEIQAIFVQREEARSFASSLSTGDLVQLTRAEALAIFVEPLGD